MDTRSEPPADQAALLKLPVGLIESIVEYLRTWPAKQDFLNFRLTHRILHEKSFRLFGKLYFEHVKTELTLKKLQRLIDIAAHPPVAKYVKTLEIIAQDFDNSDLAYVQLYADNWLEGISRRDNTRFKGARDIYDQFRADFVDRIESDKRIRESGLAHSLLTRAMSGLKNLEALSCDYNYRSQRRRLEKLWDDLLSPSEFDDDLRALDFDWDVRARRERRRCNMDIILSAVIASGVAPSKLEFSGGLFVAKKETPGSGLPETLLYERLFRNSFRNLKVLEIVLSADAESDVKYMPWFLGAACANLQELAIVCHLDSQEQDALIPIFDAILATCEFESLQVLGLSIPANATTHLSQFIRRNGKTLREIDIQISPSKSAKWSEVLRACLEAGRLESLDLSTYADCYGSLHSVTFSPEHPPSSRPEEVLEKWEAVERAAEL
ncbi:uncharacterized protein J3D65DRAFT_680591 [Phyllosticta citribraziliensis]|uniref:F-box domain-containing protein n=1 Tax=Phyllosticta citribraziliensis TaxID=989973 RepID=A0ABR1L8T4_9PEZI